MHNKQEYTTALPGYFTLKELSDILGYKDTSYLRKMCLQGDIPNAYKIEKLWFIEYNQGLILINNKK